jgi:outer membrane lipoprotein-sorting protein
MIFVLKNKQMKNFIKVILIGLIAISLSSASAQDEKAKKILEGTSKEMKSMTSSIFNFKLLIQGETKSGKAWVKGDKYKVKIGDYLIFNNGIKVWKYDGKKVCRKCDVEEEDEEELMNPTKLFTMWEEGFNYKYEKEITISGTKVHEITLTPKDPSEAEYHTVKLYVGVTSKQVKKAVITSKEQVKTTVTITSVEKNPAISDKTFVFAKDKYPGVEVIGC